VKLVRKERIGSRTRRRYDAPQTPFERLKGCAAADPQAGAQLEALRRRLDPFTLSQSIDRQLGRLYGLASQARRPAQKEVRVLLPQIDPEQAPKPYQTVRSRVTFQMAR
jgi:hypothetical protein